MNGDSLDRLFAQNVALIDTRLTHSAKSVFGRLLFYKNARTGLCYPSLETLAFDLNCSPRTIRTALRLLEETGYIKTERRWRGTRSNRYELNIPSGRQAYDKAEEQCLKYRKEPSRQQRKENIYKQKEEVLRKSGRFQPRFRAEPTAGQTVKKNENLQNCVVEKLGSGAQGWQLAMEIETSVLEAIKQDYEAGKIDVNQATAQWLASLPS